MNSSSLKPSGTSSSRPWPGTTSMVSQGAPSGSRPKSYTAQQLGCCSCDMVRNSCLNVRIVSSVAPSLAERTLRATFCPLVVSSTNDTRPMPPSPSFLMTL
ncbi:hypothetical protein D3C78_1627600 [compost metagenome]